MRKIAEIKRNTCLETLHNFTCAAKSKYKDNGEEWAKIEKNWVDIHSKDLTTNVARNAN